MRENKKPSESVESLRALKRRIYFWVLTAGLLTILLGWIPKALAGTVASYEQFIFPATTILCAGLLIALWRTVRGLFWVELSLFAVMSLSLLIQLKAILETPETLSAPNHLAALSEILFWFPLVYVFAFLVADNRRQLLIGALIFFAISLALGVSYAIPRYGTNGETADLYLLIRFYLANIVYILLLMAGVRLNEQYIRVRIHAETMRHLAHTDALIQIANRRELDQTIAREMSRAARHHQPLAIIMYDLDDFKKVNDTFGHDVGDDVLIEAAHVVRGLLRIPDLLGRWGGEEFLIVAPQTDTAQARGLAERLRQAIANSLFGRVGNITASFGVAEYRPPESPDDWLKRVDDALYAAKHGGRNQVATAG